METKERESREDRETVFERKRDSATESRKEITKMKKKQV